MNPTAKQEADRAFAAIALAGYVRSMCRYDDSLDAHRDELRKMADEVSRAYGILPALHNEAA